MSDYTPPTEHEMDARLVFRLLSMAKHQDNPRTAELMEAVAKRIAFLSEENQRLTKALEADDHVHKSVVP